MRQTSLVSSKSPTRRGRPWTPFIEITAGFRGHLRQLRDHYQIAEIRLFQRCGVSHQGALNVLHGSAKQSSKSLAAVATAAAVTGWPVEDAIVGRALEPPPADVVVLVLGRLASPAPGPMAFVQRRFRELAVETPETAVAR
jgi:hypothetical protein